MLSRRKVLVFLKKQKCFKWFVWQPISARCQYESSLAEQSLYGSWCCTWQTLWRLLDTSSAAQVHVMDHSKTGELQPCIQSQQPRNLSRALHTETVEVFIGISFVIGLWSTATFPKSSDFSKKQVFSHLPKWCRQPSDFEVWMSNSGHKKCFHFVVIMHIIKIKNVPNRFCRPVCNADTSWLCELVWMKLASSVWHKELEEWNQSMTPEYSLLACYWERIVDINAVCSTQYFPVFSNYIHLMHLMQINI